VLHGFRGKSRETVEIGVREQRSGHVLTLLGGISAMRVIHRSARIRRRYQHLTDRLLKDTVAPVSELLWIRAGEPPTA
jgi:hypothetical protein